MEFPLGDSVILVVDLIEVAMASSKRSMMDEFVPHAQTNAVSEAESEEGDPAKLDQRCRFLTKIPLIQLSALITMVER
jgi:hypothetical protein